MSGHTKDKYISINPATGHVNARYDCADLAAALEILQHAHLAFREWRSTSIERRAQILLHMADVLNQRSDELSRLISTEMGKIKLEAEAEVQKCAWLCRYYAEQAVSFLADEVIKTDHAKSLVTYQPLGVVLAIMPWNFPFWQVFRCAVPAITVGNSVVVKHAENVPQCALAIESVFAEAGFPVGLLKSLMIARDTVGELICHELVSAVSLTGSVKAGQEVGGQAGKSIKKIVLELGGSDPYLILADADLELAAEKCVQSRLINGGQSCIAAKRFLVVRSVADAFIEKVRAKMSLIKMGDPLDPATNMGPLARDDLRLNLHRQVSESCKLGATCLLGGSMPEGDGYFYPPTLLVDVAKGMPAYDEELFGPVAAVIVADTEDHAIDYANDTQFGLGAAVFTSDLNRGLQIARSQIQAGFCAVNDIVKSDPRLPFGGIKASGHGRELAEAGMKEFTNIKSITIN